MTGGRSKGSNEQGMIGAWECQHYLPKTQNTLQAVPGARLLQDISALARCCMFRASFVNDSSTFTFFTGSLHSAE